MSRLAARQPGDVVHSGRHLALGAVPSMVLEVTPSLEAGAASGADWANGTAAPAGPANVGAGSAEADADATLTASSSRGSGGFMGRLRQSRSGKKLTRVQTR